MKSKEEYKIIKATMGDGIDTFYIKKKYVALYDTVEEAMTEVSHYV